MRIMENCSWNQRLSSLCCLSGWAHMAQSFKVLLPSVSTQKPWAACGALQPPPVSTCCHPHTSPRSPGPSRARDPDSEQRTAGGLRPQLPLAQNSPDVPGLEGGRPLCYLPFPQLQTGSPGGWGEAPGERGGPFWCPVSAHPVSGCTAASRVPWSLQMLESLQMNPFFPGGKAAMAITPVSQLDPHVLSALATMSS